MHYAETAFRKLSLPTNACFILGKSVHVHFVGGSQEDHAMGGFVVMDVDIVEIIQAGWYYSAPTKKPRALPSNIQSRPSAITS